MCVCVCVCVNVFAIFESITNYQLTRFKKNYPFKLFVNHNTSNAEVKLDAVIFLLWLH